MWSKAELKEKGKAAFLRNYWYCVLVSAAMAILMIFMQWKMRSGILNILSMLRYLYLMSIVGMALNFFVMPVIKIYGYRFYIKNVQEPAAPDVEEVMHIFQSEEFKKIVMTNFLKTVYTSLWSMLLVIPGIVKGYEWYMIPYLLADFPDITTEEAFRVSSEMMNGNKWEVFMLELSFMGWNMLSAVTLQLGGIFFVNPYENATRAELYLTLKNQYFKSKDE